MVSSDDYLELGKNPEVSLKLLNMNEEVVFSCMLVKKSSFGIDSKLVYMLTNERVCILNKKHKIEKMIAIADVLGMTKSSTKDHSSFVMHLVNAPDYKSKCVVNDLENGGGKMINQLFALTAYA